MGPFHCNWSKILIAAMGKGTAENSIMKGGDYIYGKYGMSVIAEAMKRLKFEAFEQSESYCLNEGFINIVVLLLQFISFSPQATFR